MTKYDSYIELIPEMDTHGNTYTMHFGFKRTIGIRGFQKAINQWLKALLTVEGSDFSDKEYGTPLPKLFGSNITSTFDIQNVVVLSVNKALRDVQRYQSLAQLSDEDEMLAGADVLAITFDQNKLSFSVRVFLENQSGRGLQILVPIKV